MKARNNVAKRFERHNLWFCFVHKQSHIFDTGTQCRRCPASGQPQVGATFGDNLLPCVLCYLGISDDVARKTVEQRFWKYVERTDSCWLWTGGTTGGYGSFAIGRDKVAAHRFSWELHNGELQDGDFICHSCKNKACVNPVHLFLRVKFIEHRKTIEERFWKRFWERVQKTDSCWLWIGGKTTSGYGHISIGKKCFSAHRISWEIHNGPIPEGMFVCHSCDVPACVNPAHLWLGTAHDNMSDKVRKGRSSHTYGEENGNSKFTKDFVRKIRSEYPSKTHKQIASENGISIAQSSAIVRRDAWAHIE